MTDFFSDFIVNEKNFFSLLLADMHGAYEVSGCARQ